LDRFLQRIEVQGEGVGLDHVHRGLALGETIAVVQLDRTQVGDERNVGRQVAHAEGVSLGGVLQSLALRTHPECDARSLGRDGEVLVDPGRHLGAAGHAGDQ
jgi:hypothetical protein